MERVDVMKLREMLRGPMERAKRSGIAATDVVRVVADAMLEADRSVSGDGSAPKVPISQEELLERKIAAAGPGEKVEVPFGYFHGTAGGGTVQTPPPLSQVEIDPIPSLEDDRTRCDSVHLDSRQRCDLIRGHLGFHTTTTGAIHQWGDMSSFGLKARKGPARISLEDDLISETRGSDLHEVGGVQADLNRSTARKVEALQVRVIEMDQRLASVESRVNAQAETLTAVLKMSEKRGGRVSRLEDLAEKTTERIERVNEATTSVARVERIEGELGQVSARTPVGTNVPKLIRDVEEIRESLARHLDENV